MRPLSKKYGLASGFDHRGVFVLQNIDPLSIGILFQNRYRILRCIKEGPPSAVYDVVDEKTNACCLLEVVAADAVADKKLGAPNETESGIGGLFNGSQTIRMFEPVTDEETEQPDVDLDQDDEDLCATIPLPYKALPFDKLTDNLTSRSAVVAPLPSPLPSIPPPAVTKAASPPRPPSYAISLPPPNPPPMRQSFARLRHRLNSPPYFPPSAPVRIPLHDSSRRHRGIVATLAIGLGLLALGFLGFGALRKQGMPKPVEEANRSAFVGEVGTYENVADTPLRNGSYATVSPLTQGAWETDMQRVAPDATTKKTPNSAVRGTAPTPAPGQNTKSPRGNIDGSVRTCKQTPSLAPDSSCASYQVCTSSGVCKTANGNWCSSPNQCASGACSGGVCKSVSE